MVFTPTHHFICSAWQNEKYWELFREVCQKNLRVSWVLHIFLVTLMKRNLFENLTRSAAAGHWKCICRMGLHPPFTDFHAEVFRIFLNRLDPAVKKEAQTQSENRLNFILEENIHITIFFSRVPNTWFYFCLLFNVTNHFGQCKNNFFWFF